MCDNVFSESHALGLCDSPIYDGWQRGPLDGPPAHLKLRGTARIRQTGPQTTEVDHADGRVSATVRPETFHVRTSITGKDQHG